MEFVDIGQGLDNCPKLKLYYFNVAGKGEAIRLACAYGNLPFEDVRLSAAEFTQMKTDGKLAFGQLPALEVADGQHMLFQSAAIMRYIGRYCGLYPLNNFELAAKIDALVDEEIDLFTGLACSRYRERFGFGCLDAATVAQVRKALNDDVLPRHLGFLEKTLAESSTGWLANTSGPSIADFIFVPRLQWLIEPGTHDGISTEILVQFPRICKLIEQFMSLPAVQSYYNSR